MEKWKDIIINTYYQISNEGRCRSKDKIVRSWNWAHRLIKWKILKPSVNSANWYVYYSLYQFGKAKRIRAHRLVWEAFLWLDINNKKDLILHKDNDKTNNRVNNLKIWTNQENTNQCIREWRFETHKKRRNSTDYLLQTLDIRIMRKFKTNRQVAKIFWLSESYTSMIWNNRRRHYI